LTAAIRDNNPVVYLENKFLYRHYREEVPDGDYVVPIGVAALRTIGRDLSIISYGATVHHCVEVARVLERDGASVEVVDLRSLVPLDKETVLESVKKTGRALVVHEANITAGFGRDRRIDSPDAFDFLRAPVMRVASLDVPVPFSRRSRWRCCHRWTRSSTQRDSCSPLTSHHHCGGHQAAPNRIQTQSARKRGEVPQTAADELFDTHESGPGAGVLEGSLR
jgi:pyruvate/2-oxoglutarate/acetoin dehydrogenase E1 component